MGGHSSQEGPTLQIGNFWPMEPHIFGAYNAKFWTKGFLETFVYRKTIKNELWGNVIKDLFFPKCFCIQKCSRYNLKGKFDLKSSLFLNLNLWENIEFFWKIPKKSNFGVFGKNGSHKTQLFKNWRNFFNENAIKMVNMGAIKLHRNPDPKIFQLVIKVLFERYDPQSGVFGHKARGLTLFYLGG